MNDELLKLLYLDTQSFTDVFYDDDLKRMISVLTEKKSEKFALEGLLMPVLNPKTGEQDTVDLSLVHKIIIDSQTVQDIANKVILKIDITLEKSSFGESVNLIAKSKLLSTVEIETISLQHFEEIIFKAIHEEKSQRLENVQEFKDLIHLLVTRFIKTAQVEPTHLLAILNQEYKIQEGIGIIRDTLTNQDIGTFEEFTYLYKDTGRQVMIDSIILSGRTFEDLAEHGRFEFAFYSLSNQVIFSVLSSGSSILTTNAQTDSVSITQHEMLIDTFGAEHTRYHLVQQAEEKKSLLQNIDPSHPLYDSNMMQFRTNRLDILEESKAQQKQKKLVSQFSDIDF